MKNNVNDMYNRLTNTSGVQILGDTAIEVDSAPNPVKYKNQEYSVAEEVNQGLGGRFVVLIAPSDIQSFTAALPSPNTSLPFMTQRVTIPSSVSLFLMVSSAKIAAIDLIDGEPICADIFSEVSLNNGVRWPTAQTGQQIQVSIDNTDNLSAHEPRLSLTGIRLRS